jgi:transposase InsO family protein
MKVLALLRAYGGDVEEMANMLGMRPSTLRRWRRRWHSEGRLTMAPRGAPCREALAEDKDQMADIISRHGPGVGVAILRGACPHIGRDEIRCLLHELRQDWSDEHGISVESMEWTRPGSIWAMDYVKAPLPIDGIYKKVLNVRDLASGKTLGTMPVNEETAQATIDLLMSLFIQYGPPFVIKMDNGSPVAAQAVLDFLDENAVVYLLSPIRKPRYNGSIEAGNGALEVRAHHLAAAEGHPGYWNCQNVLEAGRLADAYSRPKGPKGPTPDEAWLLATPPGLTERRAFAAEVAQVLSEEIQNERKQLIKERKNNPGGRRPSVRLALARARRRAVRRVLESRGLLLVGRSRIPLPLSFVMRKRIA